VTVTKPAKRLLGIAANRYKQAEEKNDRLTMKFLLHKDKKNRNANAQNSTSRKNSQAIARNHFFAGRAVFLHAHMSSIKYMLKTKLLNYGLQQPKGQDNNCERKRKSTSDFF
jgi:hypothetical protein